MKVGELFAELLEKVGADTTSEEVKSILSISVDVPQAFADKLSAGLFTEEAAKNNMKIKNHFIAQFAGGLDQSILDRALKMNLPSSTIEKIKEEKSTGKKQQLLLEAIDEDTNSKLKAVEKSGASDVDKAAERQAILALQEDNRSLNNQLSNYKEKYVPKEELDRVLSQGENDRVQFLIENELIKKPWSANYPENVRTQLGKIALDNLMKEVGVKVVRKDGELKLVHANNVEQEYFDSKNKNVKFTELVDQMMTANKFKAVSDQTDPGTIVQVDGKVFNTPHPQGTKNTPNKSTNATMQKLHEAKQAQLRQGHNV
jgi:hypothetical protein